MGLSVPPMPFAPGDRVHIAGLGTGIVCDIRNGGRYLIEIKGRTMIVDGKQLQSAPPVRVSRSTKREAADAASTDSSREIAAPASLDLHGKTVLEAIEALDTFLSNVLQTDRQEIRVIHGRGGGRVKAAVHKRLAELPTVHSFRIDPRNPGVTIVSL
jgi:DNA mismatch repair protein MutS2